MRADSGGGRRRSPALAAFLSFLWPGLGQWYAGAPRRAAVFALPVAGAALILLALFLGGPTAVAIALLSPSTALLIIALIALAGAWRLVAMGDAFTRIGPSGAWRRTSNLAPAVALAMVVIVVHAGLASLAYDFYRAGSAIFVPDPEPGQATQSSQPIDSGRPDPSGPTVTDLPGQARVNVLLVGVDSSETRDHALTDTMLVVSLDPATGAVTMVSIPRDIGRFALSNGNTFTGKINSLMSYADRNPDEFPDGGLQSLAHEVGYMLGISIETYAAVDLAGFARMIDRVGGVTINSGTEINDPTYGGWTDGRLGFRLSAGRHTLDGQEALAFVRSRNGSSDFSRARRQQQLLIALGRKLTDPAMIPELPGILSDASDTVRTNFPQDRLGEMLAIAQTLDDKNVRRVVLNAPYSARIPASETNGIYMLQLDVDQLASLSVELFGDDSRYASR